MSKIKIHFKHSKPFWYTARPKLTLDLCASEFTHHVPDAGAEFDVVLNDKNSPYLLHRDVDVYETRFTIRDERTKTSTPRFYLCYAEREWLADHVVFPCRIGFYNEAGEPLRVITKL